MAKEGLAVYKITDLAAEDRPRERLEKNGPTALSNVELLAILIRIGVKGENAMEVAQRILNDNDGLKGLQTASFHELASIKGIGTAKAAQIKAAIELGRRLSIEKPQEKTIINSPEDAANLVKFEMSGLIREEIWVVLLDTRNRVIDIEKVYVGSLNSAFARTAELFKAAIQRNAASVIAIHNHPSGDPEPSPEDIAMTRNLVQSGKLLDIPLLDHLVIAGDRYVSLKEKRLGFD
jgi:DNA repair protein RadC